MLQLRSGNEEKKRGTILLMKAEGVLELIKK